MSTLASWQGKRCRELGPWLSAYVDGELHGVEQTPFRCRIEEHLEGCSDCVERAAQWGEDGMLLEVDESEVPAAPWFQRQFSVRLAELESDGLRALEITRWWGDATRWILWRSLPVAVILVGLGLGALLRVQLGPRSTEEAFLEGLGRLESSALAAHRAFSAEPRMMDTIDFEEVLRPGPSQTNRRVLDVEPVVSGAPFLLSEGVEASEAALDSVDGYGLGWGDRPEKDR